MTRILFSILLWAAVGRWIYAETQIIAPSLLPVLDSVISITTIPTHDKWSKDALDSSLEVIAQSSNSALEALGVKEKRESEEKKENQPHFVTAKEKEADPLKELLISLNQGKHSI
jgi:molecular chaperone GrpE (heat shock protein)